MSKWVGVHPLQKITRVEVRKVMFSHGEEASTDWLELEKKPLELEKHLYSKPPIFEFHVSFSGVYSVLEQVHF